MSSKNKLVDETTPKKVKVGNFKKLNQFWCIPTKFGLSYFVRTLVNRLTPNEGRDISVK